MSQPERNLSEHLEWCEQCCWPTLCRDGEAARCLDVVQRMLREEKEREEAGSQ